MEMRHWNREVEVLGLGTFGSGGEHLVVGLQLLVIDIPDASDASAPAAIAGQRLLGRRGFRLWLRFLFHLLRLIAIVVNPSRFHGGTRTRRRRRKRRNDRKPRRTMLAKWEAKTRRRGAEEDEPGGDLGTDGGAHPRRPGSPHAFPSSRSAIG
ncbi:unnamed protein product, partial [Musa hybrid cultivar]